MFTFFSLKLREVNTAQSCCFAYCVVKDAAKNQTQADLQTWRGQEEGGFPAIASTRVLGKKVKWQETSDTSFHWGRLVSEVQDTCKVSFAAQIAVSASISSISWGCRHHHLASSPGKEKWEGKAELCKQNKVENGKELRDQLSTAQM